MPLLTTTSDVNVNVQGYYDRNLLERAVPALLHSRFGQIRALPKKSGTKITFRRYGALPANLTPLTEGVTPTGKTLSTTDIVATMKQYGDFITITDWVNMVGLDPILLEAGEILGEQAGDTVDQIIRAILVAGTTVRYAAGVAARASIATAIADSDIESTTRTLRSNNAKMIRSMVMPGSKINTYGLLPSFIAISHTDCEKDIKALTGFKSPAEYASQKDVMAEEIGQVDNIRFLLTTNAKIWEAGGIAVGSTGLKANDSTNVDVYATLVFARNAYGVIPLQKKSIANIIKKMGSSGSEDPLNQRATSGWKTATTAKILNEDFLVRIEHGVTDL